MVEHCDSVDQVPVVLRLLRRRFRRMTDVPIWGGAELEHLVGEPTTNTSRDPSACHDHGYSYYSLSAHCDNTGDMWWRIVMWHIFVASTSALYLRNTVGLTVPHAGNINRRGRLRSTE